MASEGAEKNIFMSSFTLYRNCRGKKTFSATVFLRGSPWFLPPFFRRRHLLGRSGRYNLAYWFIYCFGCMATLFLWCLVNAAVAAPEKGSVVTSLSCVYSRTVFLGHKCAKYSLTRTFVAKGAKEESRIDKNLAWGCSIRNAPTAKSGRWKKERDRGERGKKFPPGLWATFFGSFSFFFCARFVGTDQQYRGSGRQGGEKNKKRAPSAARPLP